MSSSQAAARHPAASPPQPTSGHSRRAGKLPRLRSYAIPQHEPRAASRVLPWDEDLTPPPAQGTLALALPTVFGVETEDGWPHDALVSAQQRRTESSAGLLAEPNAWAATFIQAAMEVAGGLRSAGQLVRWTSPEVHSMLVRRGALTARARRGGTAIGAKPRLRALLGCMPGPGVCEMSAVIAELDRVRAVAFRMEGLHGRWRVTELLIG